MRDYVNSDMNTYVNSTAPLSSAESFSVFQLTVLILWPKTLLFCYTLTAHCNMLIECSKDLKKHNPFSWMTQCQNISWILVFSRLVKTVFDFVLSWIFNRINPTHFTFATHCSLRQWWWWSVALVMNEFAQIDNIVHVTVFYMVRLYHWWWFTLPSVVSSCSRWWWLWLSCISIWPLKQRLGWSPRPWSVSWGATGELYCLYF